MPRKTNYQIDLELHDKIERDIKLKSDESSKVNRRKLAIEGITGFGITALVSGLGFLFYNYIMLLVIFVASIVGLILCCGVFVGIGRVFWIAVGREPWKNK